MEHCLVFVANGDGTLSRPSFAFNKEKCIFLWYSAIFAEMIKKELKHFSGNVFSRDKQRGDRQLILPVLLSELSDDLSLEYTQFNTDNIKAGTSRR